MRVFENRASTVLYNFLRSNGIEYPFLLPANVCPIVPMTFIKAGVKFEFIDIDNTHAMNKLACLDKLSKYKYSGILFVHAYGRQFDNNAFYKAIKELDPNLLIIDDRCLCIPRLTEECHPNVDLEIFSTGYAKYVELSYGGWGILNDQLKYSAAIIPYKTADLDSQMSFVKHCLDNNMLYTKSDNLDWLDCSPLKDIDSYLSKIEDTLSVNFEHKRLINNIYRTRLPENIQWEGYTDWRFMINVEDPHRIRQEMFA